MTPANAVLLGVVQVTLAAPESTAKSQTVALVREGQAFLKAHGRAPFLREVSSAKGRFHSGYRGRDPERYLFVYDPQGICLAQGYTYQMVGKSRWEARDVVTQRLYVQEFIAAAQRSPQGAWVEYHFKNPRTQRFEPKHSFVVLVDGMVIGCGYYR